MIWACVANAAVWLGLAAMAMSDGNQPFTRFFITNSTIWAAAGVVIVALK